MTEPSSLPNETDLRSEPMHERDSITRRDPAELRRYVIRPGENLRPIARQYARELRLGRHAKKGLDALSQFLETMARTSGVEALALVSWCEPDLRPSIAVRIFTSPEPGTETSAVTTRAVAEANANLFAHLSPLVPFGGLRFHHTSRAE